MKLRITRPAREDITEILDSSEQRFGPPSRQRYERLIARALTAITSRDEPLGSRRPQGVGPAIRLYHLRNNRRDLSCPALVRPRHFIAYRRDGDDLVLVLRVLHDAMNLPAQLNDDEAG